MRKMLVFTVFAAVFALSCSGPSSKKLIKAGLYNCEERLETAKRDVERRAFSGAVRILADIEYQCGGSPVMDAVYYWSAVAHLRQKQYDDARHEFERLYREFPRSAFAEEAYFRIAHMRYIQSLPSFRDQTETKEAMRLFNDYIDAYPAGVYADSARALFVSALNKLAQKEFNNADFYRKQREHEAALIYYRTVLAQYPESRYAPEAIVGMAEMLVLLGRTQDAQEVMEALEASLFEEGLRLRIEAVWQSLKG